jgi:hypothetical protein
MSLIWKVYEYLAYMCMVCWFHPTDHFSGEGFRPKKLPSFTFRVKEVNKGIGIV